MSRKVTMEVKMEITVAAEEGVDMYDLLSGLIIYHDDDENVDVVDYDVKEHKVIDSK
jgi:hypothetical protein